MFFALHIYAKKMQNAHNKVINCLVSMLFIVSLHYK